MTLATLPAVAAAESEMTMTRAEALSLHAMHQAIAEIMPEVITRSAREPYFRESLIKDPQITLESVIHHSLGKGIKLSGLVDIKIVEDTARQINLVVPQFNEGARGQGDEVSPIVKVLLRAAEDKELAEELKNSPRSVLERETAQLLGGSARFDEGLELIVHLAEPNELVVVLPEKRASRVELSSAVDQELSLYSDVEITAYHTDTGFGCTTAFTNCFTGCSSCMCHTNSTYSDCCK